MVSMMVSMDRQRISDIVGAASLDVTVAATKKVVGLEWGWGCGVGLGNCANRRTSCGHCYRLGSNPRW